MTRRSVNLAICTDDNYAPYVSVVLRSLADHADPSREYAVYVLHAGLSEGTLAKISAPVDGANVRTIPLDVRGCRLYRELGSVKISGSHLTLAAFYRLLLPELLPETDKVLYLDCDLVIRRDVAELYDVELGSSLVAADEDLGIFYMAVDDAVLSEDFREIGIDLSRGYFNSGVLLMNLKAFRDEGIWTRMLPKVPIAARHLCDQDVLNAVCVGRVLSLDWRWNVQMVVPEGTLAFEQAWIVHYCGVSKPWCECTTKESRLWWEVALRSSHRELLGLRLEELKSGSLERSLAKECAAKRLAFKLSFGARRKAAREAYHRVRDKFNVFRRNHCRSVVKVAVTCFRKSLYLADRVFVPVHAGRAVSFKQSVCGKTGFLGALWMRMHMIGDDTRDNISRKNREYCEATVLYWMWRNSNGFSGSRYVGMMHYRRYLVLNEAAVADVPRTDRDLDLVQVRIPWVGNRRRFAEALGLTPENIEKECGKYDIIYVEASPRGEGPVFTVRDGYVENRIAGFHVEDLDLCVKTAGELFPCYRDEIEAYYHDGYKGLYNLFIVKTDIFERAARFMFAVLDRVEPLIDVSGYSQHGKRTMAYLAEFLAGFYLYHLSKIPGCRCRKVLTAFVEDPGPCTPLSKIGHRIRRLLCKARILRYEVKSRFLSGERRENAKARILMWRRELALDAMFG